MLEHVLGRIDLTILLILVVFFLVVGYRPQWWTNGGVCRKPPLPGPPSLPFFGTQWIFAIGLCDFGRLHQYYQALYRRYGPVVKEEALGNVPVISLFEKTAIEKVLKINDKYPLRPPTEALALYRKNRPDRYASMGIVNEQGEVWHVLRTAVAYTLTSPRIISNFLVQMEAIGDDWCELIARSSDANSEVTGLTHLGNRLGLEVMCALVLGRRMGFLLPDGVPESARTLAAAVDGHFTAIRDTYFGLPLWKCFCTASYRRLIRSEETIYETASALIADADDATHESDIFRAIRESTIDEREKTATIIDFLTAGIHTLKNSLIFCLYVIGKNPEAQKRILQDTTDAYLKACVNESFRLYPTADPLARILREELEVDGHRLEAGTVVLCHTGLACRDDRNFARANEFRPERWLDEGEKLETARSAAFLFVPFGIGRRQCPGKRLIEHLMPVLIKATVQKYEIVVEKDIEMEFQFLIVPKEPVTMRFIKRV